MKKIGIITICDYNNYGNRLQNYASQEVLKSLGFETETIVNTPPYKKITVTERLNKITQISFIMLIKKIIQKITRKLYKINEEKKQTVLIEKRIMAFKQFTNEYIKETNFLINQDNIPEDLGDRYDYFITGSDQVWNPDFRKGSSIDFLTFAPKYKRIAYSASFGISSLPEEYIENYRLWLSEMAHISVREEAGVNIVKDLTGREVDVLIDPTLMVNKEKWSTVIKCSNYKPIKPYLLTYFLEEVTAEVNDKIEELAKNKGLEIVHLADIEDEKRYIADPGEFLDYIDSSEVLFTDSFHGAVFSILFEKPFVIFERVSITQSMNSRIDTLLSRFRLEDRKWTIVKNNDDFLNINYSHVHEIIENERKKALYYLKNAFDIKEEN